MIIPLGDNLRAESDRPVRYSTHLKFKLQIQHILEKLPERIYHQAKQPFFDHETGRHVAVLSAIYHNHRHLMMTAYNEFEDYVEIITVHPIEKQQIQHRVTTGRWANE